MGSQIDRRLGSSEPPRARRSGARQGLSWSYVCLYFVGFQRNVENGTKSECEVDVKGPVNVIVKMEGLLMMHDAWPG